LGAALHLSAVFKIFTALPLIYSYLKYGRLAGVLCSITNLAIVALVLGRGDAAWFFVLGVVMAASVSESIKLKLKPEINILLTIGMMLIASVVLLMSYAHKVHQGPVQIIQSYVGSEVDEFVKNAEKYKATETVSSQDLDKVLIDPEVTKRNLLDALPSIAVISLLLIVGANFLLMLRMNLRGVRERLALKPDFFKLWKTPDHLVWPMLVAGFCLVIEFPVVSDIALNVFRILLAVYAIQGLAIINFLFDAWGLKGFIRPLGYILAVTFLLPLVISLGFFDLWFCFREKFSKKA
jgi:hypothetical protein